MPKGEGHTVPPPCTIGAHPVLLVQAAGSRDAVSFCRDELILQVKRKVSRKGVASCMKDRRNEKRKPDALVRLLQMPSIAPHREKAS